MTKRAKTVTMKDVAKVAGVSTSTVSLALRDNPRIPEETSQRIKTVANEMGFTPNIAGSALRATKPRLLGLFANLSQELHYRYAQEVRLAASELGYEVIVEDTNVPTEVGAAIERLAQFRVSGIIAIDPLLSAGQLEAVSSKKIPLVVIGQKAPLPNADLVVADNESAAQEIGDLFLSTGITTFTYLDGPPSFSAQVRRECLAKASNERGITMRVIPAGANLDSGFAAAKVMPPTTALVCYNDQCAEGALVALAQNGKSRDTVVIGFDDSRIARSKTFQISSVSRNPRLVATIATDMAVARDGGYRGSPVTLRVPTTLIRRGANA